MTVGFNSVLIVLGLYAPIVRGKICILETQSQSQDVSILDELSDDVMIIDDFEECD